MMKVRCTAQIEIDRLNQGLVESPLNQSQTLHNRQIHLEVSLIRLRAFVNKDFRIRIRSVRTYEKINCLVSAGQYHKHVGLELSNKHFHRVLEGRQDRYTFRLRRGLLCEFQSK